MAKVVTAKLVADGKRIRKKNTSVVEKRVRNQDGKVSILRTIDGASKTLTDDITYVFRANVAKARRDNKLIVGSADIAPAKR